jgi:hypothetical protein
MAETLSAYSRPTSRTGRSTHHEPWPGFYTDRPLIADALVEPIGEHHRRYAAKRAADGQLYA